MRAAVGALALAWACAGCSSVSWDLGYYLQSMGGHLAVMRAAQPIDRLIDDPATDARLRSRLQQVRRIRAFASRELGLPDNGSYTRYADTRRSAVLWNVFATPALSLTLTQWCFPVAGCISYRGYYDKADAEQFAARLAAQGLDVQVAPVPAYSTLGWFDDPVLNTFVNYPDGELARLLFHELAHQVLYLKGDTRFNESFATAVEQAGVDRWLAAQSDPALTLAYRQHDQRRQQFVALLRRHRERLQVLYESPAGDPDKLAGKQQVLADLQAGYQQLRQQWGGYAGYDRWFERGVNNANLASVASYTDLAPGFAELLAQQQGDLPRFYQASRQLAGMAKDERDRRLGAPVESPAARPLPQATR